MSKPVTFWSIISLLLLSFSVFADDSEYRVGVIIPLSGDSVSVGEALRNGITLGLEDIDSATRERLKLFYEDDRLEAGKSVAAFHKLSSLHNVDVVVNMSSGTGKALAPLAEQKKIPLMAIASDPEIIENREYTVNFWVTPDEETRALLPAIRERGYKKIAIVSTIHNGAFAVRESFLRLGKDDVKVVLNEELNATDRDFRSLIAKVSQTELDAILPLLMPGQFSSFAKQLRQQGVDLPLFGYEFFEDINEIKNAEGALEGSIYVNAGDPESDFMKRYQKRFPDASLYTAANGYDAIRLIAAAIEDDSRDINTFLHTVKDFHGALGVFSATDDNKFTLPASLKRVTGNGFEALR